MCIRDRDSTGALATPSAGPAGVLYVDGTANAAEVTISGSNPYKFAVTLPSLTAGQRVDMYITATIDGIATAGIVASEQADTSILSDGVAVNSIANNAITAAAIAQDAIDADSIKADAVTKIQNGLATPTNITAGTITTTTNLTNLPAITANWLTAAGIDATAVTKLQANLALEATLTAIKGVGWSTETLAAIVVLIDAIKAKTDTIGDLALKADLQDVEDKIDVIATDTTTEIPAAIAGIPAAVRLRENHAKNTCPGME